MAGLFSWSVNGSVLAGTGEVYEGAVVRGGGEDRQAFRPPA